MRRTALTVIVALAAAALAPASGLGAVEILNRGITPDPPLEGSKSTITVDVRVGQPPFTAEFFCCDPGNLTTSAQSLVLDQKSPLTQAAAGRLTFSFTPAVGAQQRQVTVRVADASGETKTQGFAFAPPVRPTPPPPPGPRALPECTRNVDVGLVEVTTQGGGCWQKNAAGDVALTRSGVEIGAGATFYETTDRFILNGIPFPAAPPGSRYVLVEPGPGSQGGRIGIDRSITIKLGPVTVLRRSFVFDLPVGRRLGARLEGALPAFQIPSGTLGGLPIGGSVQVVLRREGTRHSASFPISVTLPAVITPSPGVVGAVTGATEIRTDDTRGVSLDGGKIEVQNVAIGKVGIERLCFSYLSAGVSTRFAACETPSLNGAPVLGCSPAGAGVERFDGSIVAVLPTQSRARLGAFAGVAGGRFAYAGAFIDDAAIPIVSGIDLERLGFAFCVNPLAIRGDAGVSIGKGLIRGDVSVLYQEVRPGFFVEVRGFVRIASIPIGSGRVRVSSNGTVDFDAQASINLANGFLTIDGRIAGIIVPRPTFRFQVEGAVEACILRRFICAGAEGIVSNLGVSGCAKAGLITYSGFFRFRDGFREDGFGCGFKDRARIFRSQAREFAVPAVSFRVPPGQPQYVAHVKGEGGAPKIKVTSPTGRTFSSGPDEATSDKATFLITENAQASETSIFLASESAPGDWRVESLPGSVPLSGAVEFQEFQDKPTVVAGTVATRGAQKEVSLRYALAEGQTVGLDVVGEGFQQTVASGLQGSACPSGVTAPGRTPAESRCQTVTFTPSFGYQGTRTVQATVYDASGRVVEIANIATYEAPTPPLPTRPPAVRLIRRGSDVIAVWGSSTRLVSRYGAYAVLSDGRKLGRTTPASCLAWRITKVAPTTRVTFRVQAGRRDLEFGGAGSITLKARQRYAGPRALARAKVPRTCAPII